MHSIRRGYVDVPDGQLHYATSGDASGVPIVMLHQTASSSAMFEAVMKRLAPRRCIAVDSPGFGGSTPAPSVSIEAWASAIDTALQTMGIDRMDLVGHHTGAAVAVAVAVRRPHAIRHLALGGPPLLSAGTRERIRKRAMRSLTLQSDGAHLLDVWRMSSGYAPSGPIDLIQRETLLYLAADAPNSAMLAVIDYDFARAVNMIDCPLLLIAGDADPIIEGVQAVATLRPTALVAVIPGGGVHVFDEQPEAVAATLAAFFEHDEPEAH